MHVQFSLNRLLLFVAVCSVSTALFHGCAADIATALLIFVAASWPIVRYGDRVFLVKAITCTVLVLTVVIVSCHAVDRALKETKPPGRGIAALGRAVGVR